MNEQLKIQQGQVFNVCKKEDQEKTEKYQPKIKFAIKKDFEKEVFFWFYESEIKNHPELKHLTGTEDDETKKQEISKFVDSYYEKYLTSLKDDVVKTEQEWSAVADSFYKKVDKLLGGYPFPKGNYRGAISIQNTFPRNIEMKTFTFPTSQNKHLTAREVIAHEMLHFIVYDYMEKKYGLIPSECCDPNDSDNKNYDNTFWQFTENLNALIEDEEIWKEFTDGKKAWVKPECRELYDKMKIIWDENKDIDNLIKKVFDI